jgi:HemY protein
MFRIVLFLVLICLAAAGAAWIADQPGDVTLVWSKWRVDTSLSVFALAIGLVILAAMLVVSLVRTAWRIPSRVSNVRRRRRSKRARRAITQGLLAIGAGDLGAARRNDRLAQRIARQDPLALLLHAQTAQLAGDGATARQTFKTMAEREETRLLGLRGLFIEAQRRDDASSAARLAEQALRLAPLSGWASHAVLGFRCAGGDWAGALATLANHRAAGLIEKADFDRQRAVLLTAQALELERTDREAAQKTVREALALAPALVPAAVLSAKLFSEAQQVRKAMRVIAIAWRANPHPDLADAYGHVRLGDSAVERLARIEALAAKTPGHVESALATARAAIDAQHFSRAREMLGPLLDAPTQRVAMLMAEIERAEHGDSGRARYWTQRAVRAAHDPAWTADGYVSETWRPVSPVTGRIDAFQWIVPVAALPTPDAPVVEALPEIDAKAGEAPAAETDEEPTPVLPPPTAAEASPEPVRPLFRPRNDLQSRAAPVIPILRAPDDPGVSEDDEDKEADAPDERRRAGGFRGLLSRWGG